MDRAEFVTADTEAAHAYLRSTYAEHEPRLSGDRDRFRFRATAVSEGRFGVEFLAHSMNMRAVVEEYGVLLVPHVLAGRLAFAGDKAEIRAVPGDEFLIAPDARQSVRWENLELGVVRLELAAVEEFAAETTDGVLRFPLSTPVSAAHARYWRAVIRHVSRDFLAAPECGHSELVRTGVFRLLAAALLQTFPIVQEDRPRHFAVQPAAVRRAVEFIDANARADITLTQIAAVARVSPRALQAAFRRHLDTSPTAYLRRARLAGAHAQLQTADATAGDTVAAIASAWGFAHHGRFAAAYRDRYGRSPQTTLLN